MIVTFFLNYGIGILADAPVLSIPDGYEVALNLFSSLVGYINIFIPLSRVAPILLLVIAIRNWNIMIALLRFILRLVPFMGG